MSGDRQAVTLYTREGCHLCEQARDALRRLGSGVAFELREVDVDGDSDLVARYGDRVPVVAVAGREVTEGRIELGAVRRALVAGAVDSSRGRS